jgi:hypothetical protein
MTFKELVEHLNMIPQGLYLFACAWVAFGGTWWTLRAHSKREKANRLAELRRNVFLEGVAQLARARQSLAKYPSLQWNDKALDELVKDYNPTVQKVYLVANRKTREALSAFELEYQKVHLEFLTHRLRLMILTRQYQEANARSELKSLAELEPEKLRTEMLAHSKKMYGDMVPRIIDVGRAESAAIGAMRDELELQADTAKFIQQLNDVVQADGEGMAKMAEQFPGPAKYSDWKLF